MYGYITLDFNEVLGEKVRWKQHKYTAAAAADAAAAALNKFWKQHPTKQQL